MCMPVDDDEMIECENNTDTLLDVIRDSALPVWSTLYLQYSRNDIRESITHRFTPFIARAVAKGQGHHVKQARGVVCWPSF
jgi:hypothetical protein